MLEKPLFMQGNTYASRRLRELVGYVFDVEGVIKPETGALKVAPRADGANMSVDVAAGACAILGDDAAGQGMYVQPSTAVENLPIGAAPGSNSRIDLVVARVRDASVTGGVSSDWVLEVIPGDVAGVPVAKPVPASAIPLAQVLVAAGTLSITGAAGVITDRRTAAANAAYAPRAYSGARGKKTVTQSIPTGTLAVLSFDAEDWDVGGYHDNLTNSNRLTVPAGRAGYFAVTAVLGMNGTSGTFREVYLRKGALNFASIHVVPAPFGRYLVTGETSIVAGDYFDVAVKHDAATALDATLDCFFVAHFIGA